jgi:uncharacterized membrane protein YedE/YeeE
MFETLGFETLTPRAASLWLGLALGLAFGALAEATRFCLRRGLAGDAGERRPALALWLTALAAAVVGTQGAVAAGLIDFSGHRFHAADLPWLAIIVGGALFGAGMVLARGCASRLTVLAASGNLRAATVLLVLALAAHATMKGVLAPIRTALSSFTLPPGELTVLPGGLPLALAGLAAALWFAHRSRIGLGGIAGGLAIGALIPLGWIGTGLVLHDAFDPIAVESLAFTAALADTLFWAIAATAIDPGFGAGVILGTLAGAALAALGGGRFRWQSFGTPRETGRYLTGGALMGIGGVLAGGCTVGAGLSGVATMSVAAMLALAAIAAGAVATDRALSASSVGSGARAATRPAPRAA